MATSGKVTVKVTNYDNLVFEWTLKSQSIENNSSEVGWKMTLVAGSSGAIISNVEKAWTVTVNGTKYTGTSTNGIGNNETKTLASGSTTIAHNSDGTKTFAFSFKQVFKGLVFAGESITDKSGSGNGTLPTIARASQPSCITWPEHTQHVGFFGDTIAIHMNRLSDKFTHTVRYRFGARTGTIGQNVPNNTVWKIPLNLMDLIPNSISGSGTIFVDTYNGDTLIGTKSCGFTAQVPASVVPSCTFTLEDTSGIDDIYGSPVKSLSTIKVKVTGTPAYSSPIVAYSVSIDGATYTTAEFTTGVLRQSGTSRVTATVTDSRGRKASHSYDMSVQNYVAPVVSLLTVHRCNSDGTENDQGEYVKATFSAAITSLNSKNTATYTLRYKQASASSWTSVSLTELANVYTLSNRTYIFAADGNSSYDVDFTAKDRHKTVVSATSVSTAFTLLNWGSDGTSMGVGKVAEAANTLSIALSTQQLGNRYAFTSLGKASTAGYVLIARVRMTHTYSPVWPITFVITRSYANTPMTVHLRLSKANGVESIVYEGTNYDAYASPSDDLTWNLYVKKVNSDDAITLQDWYTSPAAYSRVEVTFPGTLATTVPEPYYKATPAELQSILDFIYPVGSIYIAYNHTNPGTIFGGTWTRISGAFLWAVSASGTIGQTGGSQTHTLTVDEMPSHSHGSVYTQHATTEKNKAWYTASGASIAYGPVATGGGKAHNNMPPYIQVSVWRRTA